MLPGGWPGIGWFRRRVTLADGMPTTALGLRVEQRGASEVYLDGRLIVTAGTVSDDPAVERPVYPNDFGGVAFEAGSLTLAGSTKWVPVPRGGIAPSENRISFNLHGGIHPFSCVALSLDEHLAFAR